MPADLSFRKTTCSPDMDLYKLVCFKHLLATMRGIADLGPEPQIDHEVELDQRSWLIRSGTSSGTSLTSIVQTRPWIVSLTASSTPISAKPARPIVSVSIASTLLE